jgi:hypothetical protein
MLRKLILFVAGVIYKLLWDIEYKPVSRETEEDQLDEPDFSRGLSDPDEIPLSQVGLSEEAVEMSYMWLDEISSYAETIARTRAKHFMRQNADASDVSIAYATLMDPQTIMNIGVMVNRKINAANAFCMTSEDFRINDSSLPRQDDYRDDDERLQ